MTAPTDQSLSPEEIFDLWFRRWADTFDKVDPMSFREGFLNDARIVRLGADDPELVKQAIAERRHIDDIVLLVNAFSLRSRLSKLRRGREPTSFTSEEVFSCWLLYWRHTVVTRSLTSWRETLMNHTDMKALHSAFPAAVIIRTLEEHSTAKAIRRHARNITTASPAGRASSADSVRWTPPPTDAAIQEMLARERDERRHGNGRKVDPLDGPITGAAPILGQPTGFTSGGGPWMSTGPSRPEGTPVERCSRCKKRVPDGAQHDCK